MNQAIGTEAYHKFWPNLVLTDGVLTLVKAAECFWLLDVIASYQHNQNLDKTFQVWTLEVNRVNSSGIVRGYNDTKLIITQKIPYTNFPLDDIKLYLIKGVILLPSEY